MQNAMEDLLHGPFTKEWWHLGLFKYGVGPGLMLGCGLMRPRKLHLHLFAPLARY